MLSTMPRVTNIEGNMLTIIKISKGKYQLVDSNAQIPVVVDSGALSEVFKAIQEIENDENYWDDPDSFEMEQAGITELDFE